MELEMINQEIQVEPEREKKEDKNENYFSIWDLWVGVASRLLDDFTGTLW